MVWKRKRLEAMEDEDLQDFYLVGTDGEEVACNKAILATISPVFKNMFFKGYKEQKTDRCNLDFHSLVIQLVVKYCYCGELDMDEIFNQNRPLEEEATILVDLREAGRYFEMEGLKSAVERKIGDLVFVKESTDNKNYRYAAAVYTELFQREEDYDTPLGTVLLSFVQQHLMECFGPRVVDNAETCLVPPSVLAYVLGDEPRDPYAIVKCFQTWFSLESKSTESRYSDEDKEELLEIAKEVDLATIPMKYLVTIEPCALFSSERIRQAFVCQYYNQHGVEEDDDDVVIEAPKNERQLHVIGAGNLDLDDVYKQLVHRGEKLPIFSVRTRIEDVTRHLLIHWRPKEKRWLMSITKNRHLNIKRQDDGSYKVHESCVQKHVYESSCAALDTEDPMKPPFSGWTCVEGTSGPVPIVACFYRQEPSAAQEGN